MENNLKELLKDYDLLEDLCLRLQNDYNSIKEFEQQEEDRIIIYRVLELLENYKNEKVGK